MAVDEQFVLQENIKVFRRRLAEASDDEIRTRLQTLLAMVEREYALLVAAKAGAAVRPWRRIPPDEMVAARVEAIQRFHAEFDGSGKRASLIDPAPGLRFVDVAGPTELAPGRVRSEMIGQALFDLFPDNSTSSAVENVSMFYSALRTAAESGESKDIAHYRSDLLTGDGQFVERHWQGVCRPLNDDQGRLVFLLLVMDDITQDVGSNRPAAG
jgi:PAS domain-containing protein